MHPCTNYNQCRGYAANGERLCECCREAERREGRDRQTEKQLEQLEKKPRDWRDVFKLGRRR